MIQAQPIGLLNTGLPAAALALGAAALPRLIAGPSLSQRRLALAVALTAAVLLLLGALIFAALYALAGAPLGAALAQDGALVAWVFLRLSAKAALLWGPVLALAWLVLAQGVERRRGEAIMREGRQ